MSRFDIFSVRVPAAAVMLVAGACLFGCAQQVIRNIDSTGRNIVCFGDSITFGYGAEQGEDYPAALGKMVGVPVINAGIDGDTTAEALRRIQSDVLERDPFMVIIEFGGNDFLRKVPLEKTVENLRQMVERIQERGAMVVLVDVSAGLFLREYRSAYADLARSHGAIFVSSILDRIITNPRMKSDFLHPNAEGYGIIAKKIYQMIGPYCQRSSS